MDEKIDLNQLWADEMNGKVEKGTYHKELLKQYPTPKEMDEWHALNIRLQMEMLITERESMIAENWQRIHRGESMAHVEDSFQILNSQFTKLWETLKDGRQDKGD